MNISYRYNNYSISGFGNKKILVRLKLIIKHLYIIYL